MYKDDSVTHRKYNYSPQLSLRISIWIIYNSIDQDKNVTGSSWYSNMYKDDSVTHRMSDLQQIDCWTAKLVENF